MQIEIGNILGLWTQEKGPLYQRLALALRRAIETTALPSQTRLPVETGVTLVEDLTMADLSQSKALLPPLAASARTERLSPSDR